MYDTGWIRQSLDADWNAFQGILKTALDSPYALLSSIDAYILRKPGKQLRPALALCAARICGTPGPLSHAVAAVAEMIHTASLLHDDVADNAQTRRGKESVQKQFGPHAAIVLGDFWLARAFQVLLQHNGTHLLPLYADVIEDLSQGELFQMEKAKTLDVTPIEYYTICKKKTASLFYAAIMSGAMSVPEKEKAAEFKPLLEHAAYHMGMAFQIRDDLEDLQADLAESKMTLPLLGALVHAGDQQHRPQVKTWIHSLEQGNNASMEPLLGFVEKHKGREYALQVLNHHTDSAREQLGRLPDSVWKECLLVLSGM
jgi:octaprenyl-diphosphate synthase